MTFTEVNQDLFMIPKDYVLVHCISADFALGAGIAKEFAKKGVRKYLINCYSTPKVGMSLTSYSTGWKAEVNLITKYRYWHKPTYDSLKQSLYSLKQEVMLMKWDKLAMPRIGCGLDKLEWDKVKQIINDTFADTDIEIIVCSI